MNVTVKRITIGNNILYGIINNITLELIALFPQLYLCVYVWALRKLDVSMSGPKLGWEIKKEFVVTL